MYYCKAPLRHRNSTTLLTQNRFEGEEVPSLPDCGGLAVLLRVCVQFLASLREPPGGCQ